MRIGLVQGRMGPDDFLNEGLFIGSRKKKNGGSKLVKIRHFRSHFGTDPEIASSIWTRIRCNPKNELPRNAKTRHLLWALLFMKTYTTDSVLCGIAGGVDPKTFRKWRTIFIKEIAKLASEEVSKFVDVHEYFIHFIYPFEI